MQQHRKVLTRNRHRVSPPLPLVGNSRREFLFTREATREAKARKNVKMFVLASANAITSLATSVVELITRAYLTRRGRG